MQRTYWHLEQAAPGRVPTSYEIATTSLLYYPERGFELPTPIAGWYERHQAGSRLRASWRSFADPRATTYAGYVARQHERETFVDRILGSIDDSAYDAGLDPSWLAVLELVLPVLRYPGHALHMLACYVGHMAPEGRVVVTCAFQAMDEVRRIQRLAYRMRQLQATREGFGSGARQAFETSSAWQPLRRVLERLLVTYDFGEAAVATLLVVKPALDELFMRGFARLAAARGDRLLFELFSSLDQDCRWHAEWADAFIQTALLERPENAEPIADWVQRWWPEVSASVSPLVELFGVSDEQALAIRRGVEAACTARWSALGVASHV